MSVAAEPDHRHVVIFTLHDHPGQTFDATWNDRLGGGWFYWTRYDSPILVAWLQYRGATWEEFTEYAATWRLESADEHSARLDYRQQRAVADAMRELDRIDTERAELP